METNRTCAQCQQPLSADAPDGLCPQCLMKAASGPLPSAAGDGLPGDIIDIGDPAEVAKKLPQFEIIEMLGRGGMGVVYKARQVQLDRLVALKILPPVDALSPDFVARFTREARALAKLNHPNIVHVHDFGETGGLYYITMEYVDGANLRQLLQTRKLAPAEALAIVPKICDALEYAHEEGLVHRDIKPENLLIDKKGRVKIADFGLAKLLRREPLDMTLTLTGMALGTLRYMAPEQMDKPETVDHRADIYSLGVVIYEMLTGDVPMGHFAPPSQTAGVDVRLDKIVLHALEREPAHRYQHASEVKSDVENVTTSAVPGAFTPPIAKSGGAMESPSPGESVPAVSARLSRIALLGAIWAGIGLPAGLLVFAAFTMTWRVQIVPGAIPQAEHAPIWIMLITIPLALIAATAPFGTTILGAISIGQIKRSGGRLYGLRLAAADVLFFPLLVLGGLATILTSGVFQSFLPPNASIKASPGIAVALVVCFLVARAAWRSIAGIGRHRAKSTAERLFAGSGLQIALCITLAAVTLWFVLEFGFPVFTMITGPDIPLIELCRRWSLGTTVDSIFSKVAAIFALLAAANFFAWREYRHANMKRQKDSPLPDAVPTGTKPPRRHLLTTFLTLLCLGAFIFGVNFRAKSEMTPAGRTSVTTVGSFDPLFVYEGGPSGFHSGFQIFSWSFFAIIVAGVSFAALWRVSREDEGKVARDPAWWRDWWKQVGIWCGLLFLACAIRTAMNPRVVFRPVEERSVPVEESLPVSDAPLPRLGAITDGFSAEFTVPAGQVATFEIVTRTDNATVPIPNLAAYVIAPLDQPSKGTFRWSRELLDFSSGKRRQPWRIEVRTPGGGKTSSGGLDLPEELEPVVGARSYGLALTPDGEAVHWPASDENNLPANGLVGLRVRTQSHGLKPAMPGSNGGLGTATINWMEADAKTKP